MQNILVKPTSRGQITLPKSIRQKLSVTCSTYLNVSVKGNEIILQPVDVKVEEIKNIRIYTDKQIAEFLEEDKLSKEDAAFLKHVLNK